VRKIYLRKKIGRRISLLSGKGFTDILCAGVRSQSSTVAVPQESKSWQSFTLLRKADADFIQERLDVIVDEVQFYF
jgi:hypothetical protein